MLKGPLFSHSGVRAAETLTMDHWPRERGLWSYCENMGDRETMESLERELTFQKTCVYLNV